jgi:hypothetical protein
MHIGGSADEPEIPSACARRRVRLEHQTQPHGIQESHAAQIEYNALDPGGGQRLDLFTDLADRVDIDLAERTDTHAVAFRVHDASKRRG